MKLSLRVCQLDADNWYQLIGMDNLSEQSAKRQFDNLLNRMKTTEHKNVSVRFTLTITTS